MIGGGAENIYDISNNHVSSAFYMALGDQGSDSI